MWVVGGAVGVTVKVGGTSVGSEQKILIHVLGLDPEIFEVLPCPTTSFNHTL